MWPNRLRAHADVSQHCCVIVSMRPVYTGGLIVCIREARQSGRPGDKYTVRYMEVGPCLVQAPESQGVLLAACMSDEAMEMGWRGVEMAGRGWGGVERRQSGDQV